MAEYIGTMISLTSRSDIRYIGKLEAVNTTEATVSLSGVRSLGTEGRKGDPALEIPPNEAVYDFIVFRASDVKNLTFEPSAPPQAAPPPMPEDPAIMSSQRPANMQQNSQSQVRQQPTQPAQEQQQAKQEPFQNQRQNQSQQNQSPRQDSMPPQNVGHMGGPGFPGSPWGPHPMYNGPGPYGYGMLPPPPGMMMPPPGMGGPGPGPQSPYSGPFAQQAAHQPWGNMPMGAGPGGFGGFPPRPMQGGFMSPPPNQQQQQPVASKPKDADKPIVTTTNALPDSAAPPEKEQPTVSTSSAAAQNPSRHPQTQAKATPKAPSIQQTRSQTSQQQSSSSQGAVIPPFPAGMAVQTADQLDKPATGSQAQAQAGVAKVENRAQPSASASGTQNAQNQTQAKSKPTPTSFASAVSATTFNGKPVATAGPALQAKQQQQQVAAATPVTRPGANDVQKLAKDIESLSTGPATDGQQRGPQSGTGADGQGSRGGRAFSAGGRGGRGRGGIANGVGAPRQNGREQSSLRSNVPVPSSDFDFAASNERFDKQNVQLKKAGEGASAGAVDIPAASPEAFYDKASSFFDTISSDLNTSSGNDRFDRNQERSKNMATFGQAEASGNFRGRGRGYRGGGGRGRGGSRGGASGFDGNRGRGDSAPRQASAAQ